MAIGLGSMDMPVPSVAEWEWLNWRFPRQVHAGETIYARWTLTQKRPPAQDAASAIVVWRVDVHTADGALCAEGEVGAKVVRHKAALGKPKTGEAAAAPGVGTPAPRRRRRRRAGANGHASEPAAAAPAQAKAPPPAAPKTRAPGAAAPKRRRRRRAPSSAAQRDGEPGASSPPAANPAPVAALPSAPAAEASPGTPDHQSPIGRVISRLRRT